jgi:hypothetical protein
VTFELQPFDHLAAEMFTDLIGGRAAALGRGGALKLKVIDVNAAH